MSVQKDGSIVINQFPGIGTSPITGFGDFRNLDLFSEPGIVRLNQQTEKVSSTTITGLVKWIVQDPTNGDLYALDDSGKVYTASSAGSSWSQVTGNTTTSAAGNGLAIFVASDGDRFLIVCRNTVIDVYDIGGTTWSTGWQTDLNSNAFHPVIVGQDNIIYIGHGNLVASILENGAFAPGTGSTFTYNVSALDLPKEYAIRCLCELGKNLMIGTTKTSATGADIFPWDRTSSSFGIPLKIQDDGVKAMLTANNTLYIFTGSQGNIHISNGTFVQFVRSLPYHSFNFYTGQQVDILPGAVMRFENQIYFGVSTIDSGAGVSGGAHGVFAITLDGKILTFEYQISTGTTLNSNIIRIGALYPLSKQPLIGWRDNTTYGMDQVDSADYYGNYVGYFDTPLYNPGLQVNKKTYSQTDILLARPLTTSLGVRLKYRKNLTDTFSSALFTFDYATYGGVSSINLPVSIADIDQIQLRIELTSPGTGTPELRQLVLR